MGDLIFALKIEFKIEFKEEKKKIYLKTLLN